MSVSESPIVPIRIYVPRTDTTTLPGLLAASAVVSCTEASETHSVHVYFEGNRYPSADMARFADRVKFAAARCRTRYPTSAEAIVGRSSLTEVAQYDDFLGIVTPLGTEQAALLIEWIHSDDPNEMQATGLAFEARRHNPQRSDDFDTPP
jgi:hypothetical protein